MNKAVVAGSAISGATADRRGAPLQGIKVLDLSRVLAAPFCAMQLADLGADVIKVENPVGGDQTRQWGKPLTGGERSYYLAINRTKRSIAIDFTKPEGAQLVRALARQSDILLENYLLGTLERYGLGYDDLKAENPRLIYCSISGYGRSGPAAHRPGYDSVIQAESGLMSVTGEPDRAPVKVGISISDISGGLYATQAILAALFARERTGQGDAIDIALLDCTMANQANVASGASLLNTVPKRYGSGHPDIVPQGMYAASDGDIVLQIGSERQFAQFCKIVLEQPELAVDPRFKSNDERQQNRDALNALIGARLATKAVADWLALFEKAGVPAGPLRNVLEAINSPEAAGRGLIREIDHPTAGKIRLVGSPIKFTNATLAPPLAPPQLGQHTDEILSARLDCNPAEIARLREIGIVA